MSLVAFFRNFIYQQFVAKLPIPTHDFSGQTIIVTGSNTGLGLEAVRHLSKLNAALIIIAVRGVEKGEAAKKAILATTSRKDSTIEVWELDLLSFESVRAFAARASKLDRLDAVLENAGILTRQFRIFEGYESQVATNVIGTFLLALLILPKLKETATKFNVQPRLSIVSSDGHLLAKFEEGNADDIFAALHNEANWPKTGGFERYIVTKLIEIFAVRELVAVQKAEAGSLSPKVIINVLSPGASLSDFFREDNAIQKIGTWLLQHIAAHSAEEGSRNLVAAVAAGEESHGEYLESCALSEVSISVRSAEGQKMQKKVWAQLLAELEKIQPGISANV